jgi:HK97 family phage portal protein
MADIRSFFTTLYQRMTNGDSYYFIDEYTEDKRYGVKGNNLEIAQDHPILTPALLFVAKLFSQAQFELKNTNTGKKVKDNNYVNLLKNPNHYQTSIDFFESLYFMMIAQGKCVVYKKRVPGGMSINSLYILNSDLIEWPQDFKTKMLSRNLLEDSNEQIKYDRNGENIDIKIKDLLFFYDLPSCLHKNFFLSKSRIDGLKQTLENTKDSLVAKNIILRTNGKELITGKAGANGTGFTPDEKDRVERIYQADYGLSKNRKRAIITRADITHKSLHIALRDLGLDESIKVDGNLIFTALHIPKDILSLEAKKTTYNNFKESMVSFIQNEIQGTLDYVLGVIDRDIKKENANLELTGNYNHLPVMQYILLEKYDVVKKRGEALSTLRKAGLPDEVALEMCDLDSSIKLSKLTEGQNEQTGNSNSESSSESS